ncbi:MAG: tRNA glutamyl-Q(34) synthetase GluQRS [Gammaproteobacteria bacterium]
MTRVRGRFAPTPSGLLHFGSLVAAIASYLNAKSRGGQWLIRIDDLDSDRNVQGASEDILKTLEKFGLFWDGNVLYQSDQIDIYNDAIDELSREELIYPCICTRKKIGNNPYSGTCRTRLYSSTTTSSLRMITENKILKFHDVKQGIFKQNIEKEVGDFIVKRSDGYIAYHLANVVDDQIQGITEVVRGADLLDSTPRQIYLQKKLGYSQPEYLHLPVAVDQEGLKLSKSNGSLAIKNSSAPQNRSELICNSLSFLGQSPPESLKMENVDVCIEWGISNWNVSKIPELSSKEY